MELERVSPGLATVDDDRARRVLDYVGDRVAERVHAKAIAGVQLTADQVRALLDAFLERTADASKTYRDRLAGFTRYLGAESTEAAVQRFFALNQGEMNSCIDGYRRHILKTRAAATARLSLSALRSLAKKARLMGLASAVPEFEPIPKEPVRTIRPASPEKVKAVLAELGHLDTAKALRDRAMIALLYIHGLRVSEACTPRYPEDLDLEGRRLRIKGKKRTTKEWVPLTVRTCRYLADWVAERGTVPGALFPMQATNRDKQKPFSRHTLNRIVSVEYGLSNPHALRHAAGVEALDATGDVHKVQQFLRHSDLSTTQTYLVGRKNYAGEVAQILAGEPVESETPTRDGERAQQSRAKKNAVSFLGVRDAAIVQVRNAGLGVIDISEMKYPEDVNGRQWLGPAMEWLKSWVALRGDWPGPLFIHARCGPGYEARDPLTAKMIEYVIYQKRRKLEGLTPPQVAAPLPAPPTLGVRDARDAAIRHLLASGKSPAELAAMQYPADADGRAFSGPLGEYLEAWVRERGRWPGPLFTGTTNGQGHTMSGRAIRDAAAGGRNGRQERAPASGRYRRQVTRRRMGTPVSCPRCGNDAFVNTTRRKGAREVVRYYKCPTCLYCFRKRQTTVDGVVSNAEVLETAAPAGRAWDLARLYEHEAAAVSWVWPGYLARGALTLLAGEPKAGKSTLLFGALDALLRGGAFLGSAVAPLPVLYFTEEPAATIREKCEAFGLTKDLPLSIVFRSEVRGAWTQALAAANAHLKDRPALLVLDTLAAWGMPETNVPAIEEAGNALKGLAARYNVPVLALHHTRKNGGTGLARIRGHSALAGAVDVALVLEQCGDGVRRLHGQGRFLETPERLHYAMDGGRLVLVNEADQAKP